jgi:quercetin dioxygenase-like cupin family protein
MTEERLTGDVAAAPEDPCASCPYAAVDRAFCRWPHRCLFHGDGVQAWLVGLSPGSAPLRWTGPAARLTLTVTHGEARVRRGDRHSRLRHGESLTVPPGERVSLGADEEADVLVLVSFVAE